MHIKVFLKLKKTLKPSLLGKKPPKQPTGLGFFKKTRVFSNPDPDPDPHQSDGNLRRLFYRPSRSAFWASLKLLNFDFNADPDPAFITVDPMRIRIRNPACSIILVSLRI